MAVIVASAPIATTGTTRTSAALDMTGVNLIVFPYVAGWGASPTFSDSEGNSYTSHGSITWVPFTKGGFNYIINPSVSSSMTFSLGNCTTNTEAGAVAGFRCGTTPSVDNLSTQVQVNATSITQNSVTPSADYNLIFSLVGKWGLQTTATIDSGFTTIADFGTSGSQWFGMHFGYINQTVAGAAAPTITVAGTQNELGGQQASFLVGPDGRPISQGYIF